MKLHITAPQRSEAGEIMLEGMIVVIVTLFVLLWLLGLGFIYYQRYITTAICNDAAVKIAATYNNPSADIVMGFVTTEDMRSRSLYRNTAAHQGNLEQTNQSRAESYIRHALKRANFSGVLKGVQVELTLVSDSHFRKHIQLVTECTYRTPFGFALGLFGLGAEHTYRFTSCADCTDYFDYIAMVDFQKTVESGTYLKGTGFVDSIVNLLNTLAKVYNHVYS